ncbi:hypothetical protein BpHYR1_037767 [Brachionus plicatilis]|uniref:Uncharacterized protein n=1 Tax=Brachionus plicatilis TaxID=10195 RepID=A0A3M7RAI7_BRAPC|nr:hypothetical protein BpHYR1_037767 [Brachionus plicatilis]
MNFKIVQEKNIEPIPFLNPVESTTNAAAAKVGFPRLRFFPNGLLTEAIGIWQSPIFNFEHTPITCLQMLFVCLKKTSKKINKEKTWKISSIEKQNKKNHYLKIDHSFISGIF